MPWWVVVGISATTETKMKFKRGRERSASIMFDFI